MKKMYFIPFIAFIMLSFSGCGKQPVATVEATDYAMSCEALREEIKNVRSQWQAESDQNTAKNIIGGVLTLGIYDADEEKELMLRERAKSLQLIYTIKQAKGECEPLTKEDIKVDNTVQKTVKETKETVKSLD